MCMKLSPKILSWPDSILQKMKGKMPTKWRDEKSPCRCSVFFKFMHTQAPKSQSWTWLLYDLGIYLNLRACTPLIYRKLVGKKISTNRLYFQYANALFFFFFLPWNSEDTLYKRSLDHTWTITAKIITLSIWFVRTTNKFDLFVQHENIGFFYL